MKSFLNKLVALLLFSMVSAVVLADSAVGVWKTIDDESKQPKALVQIIDTNGELSGKIIKLFAKPDARCEQCEGDKQGKPVLGMQILWGLRADGAAAWSDGSILDPHNGKTYRVSLKLQDDGQTLRVRGYIGPFYRTQLWQRQ
ncbi:DUF2147 domain-containing protein [Neisseriaceae bacterium TC5R-5]|nr:DUF2147 domain-containing protein [Neisseriaceae bacterium TC5R-5]